MPTLRAQQFRLLPRMRAWLAQRRSEVRLALRMTAAALASFAIAHLLGLPQGYWAVFTAVLIMQTSVGGSLQAIIDRLLGTLGGASYGAIVATLVPHGDPAAMGVAVAVSLAPLALLAAIDARFRVAPITAMIVLLGNFGVQEGPVEAAFYRMIAVGLGSLIGLVVALAILPSRAHALMCEAAQRMLELLAQLMSTLLQALTQPADRPAVGQLHDDIRKALAKLETIAAEAGRERRSLLTDELDPEPIPRTLRRLRHDLVMIGRVAVEPLPKEVQAALAPALARVSEQCAGFLRAAGAALIARKPAPDFTDVDSALVGFAVSVASLVEGEGRHLPRAAIERVSALGFAFEQLRRDCKDLANRIQEFARTSASKAPAPNG